LCLQSRDRQGAVTLKNKERKNDQKIVDDIVANAVKKISTLESKSDGLYKEVPFKPDPIVLD
jgi:hypothetical protein